MQAPFNEKEIDSWNCAYPTEVGCIIFNTAVLHDRFYGVEPYQQKLREAALNLGPLCTPLYRTFHNLSTFKSAVTPGTKLRYRNREYRLIHCCLRVRTFLLLDQDDIKGYLNFLMHHLFTTYDRLIETNLKLLDSKPDLFFQPEGFPISSSLGLKFLVHSMKIKLSGNDPIQVPFTAQDDLHSVGCTKTITLPKSKHGSKLVKATFSRRSLLRRLAHPYAKLFGNELCYLCGYKLNHQQNQETWQFHLHKQTPKHDPLDLQTLAKLTVMEACFLRSRMDE